jgi:quercetin dioxygenase-like cupin family protein
MGTWIRSGFFSVVIVSAIVLGGRAFAQTTPSYGEYPVPGRLDGTTAFSHEKDAEHRASKPYPAWFRGKAPNSKADKDSKYYYTQLVGPKKLGYEYITSGLNANNMQMGTLALMPGATYPAHNHPAREVYYVIEGEADWYVDDEKQHVTPGSTIMHRPYAVHGWTATGEKPLKVVWMQWTDDNESPDVLDKGARLVNPEIAQEEKNARPFAIPIPPVKK